MNRRLNIKDDGHVEIAQGLHLRGKADFYRGLFSDAVKWYLDSLEMYQKYMEKVLTMKMWRP